MIFFVSDGRLGNQLFQISFLKEISEEKEIALAFNMKQFTEGFDYVDKNIKIINLNRGIYLLIKKIIKPTFFFFLVNLRFIGYYKQERNKNSALPSFNFQKGLLPLKLVETDFFQSEQFFKKKKLNFKIKNSFIENASKYISSVPASYTKVFVHIRRGDYLNEIYCNVQGINLPLRYYKNGMDEVSKDIDKPFFIFLTDDKIYVQENFKYLKNKIVSDNDMLTDLSIMSLCDYGVVSNSSFSWWGAYLMKNRKKVVFPKYWYGWKVKLDSHLGIHPKWAKTIDV